jgi:ring-1,2-phenylacetyl-CoA epoxidase subunit PaaE
MVIWTLRVSEIKKEALDTHTIFLQRTDGGPFSYIAGQFLTLLFPSHAADDREIRRSYSFSSTPGIDPVPAITVKRVPNGEISRHLLDHIHVGDTLKSLAPSGRFFLEEQAAVHFFLAAGSGMVPIFSLLKQALAGDSRVVLISQFHDRESAPFYDALQILAASYGSGRLVWIDLLTIRNGRLTNGWLEEWLFGLVARETFPETRFYICGPPAFIRMGQFTLRTLGIPEAHIKKEHFTVEHIPAPPPVFDRTPRTVVVHDGNGDYSYHATWPDTILQAGEKHGIHLPFSCRAGRCSTCVARCIKGTIKMTNNEVLTDNDVREGLVLTCVGYAETDVELSFGLSAVPPK